MTKQKNDTTIVTFEDFADPEFKAPTKYYFKNASGDFVFIHRRTRESSQSYLDETYGKGFYKVRSYGVDKQDKELTARG